MYTIARSVLLKHLLVVAGSFLGAQLMILFIQSRAFGNLEAWATMTIFGLTTSLSMFYGHRYMGSLLKRYISWVHSPFRSFAVHFVSGTLLTLLLMCTINYVFLVLVMGQSFEDFVYNNWFSIRIALAMYISISFLVHMVVFYMQWRQAVLEQEKQQHETLRLRFEALRNHVNPHFLFNVLSTLTQLIRTDPDRAIDFTNTLAGTFRAILETKDKDLIPLAEEMQLVEAYLHLQKIRFGDYIQIQNRISQAEHWLVIPVSVQMLLENVFKHNALSRSTPVQVEMWVENQYLHIRNNRVPKAPEHDRSPSGLANIRLRYAYLTQRPCVVQQDAIQFTTSLPLIANLE